MRFLNLKETVPVMKYRKFTALVSAVLVTLCVVSLAVRGLNFGIDFSGGTVIEVAFSERVPESAIRDRLAEVAEDAIIQPSGESGALIKLRPSDDLGADVSERVLAALRAGDVEVDLRRVEFVGPQVSDELFLAGAVALFFVCLGIMVYLSLRFKWRLAVGAIVANLHDVVFILGLFSILGLEFDLPVLAAVLAILGYSVNESVVIFDRVRENFRASRRGVDVIDVIDASITQTWSRTVITHGSTQLAILAMLLFGGDALFLFALALTIGIFSSIYSSILIASPVALRLGLSREDLIERQRPKGEDDGAVV